MSDYFDPHAPGNGRVRDGAAVAIDDSHPQHEFEQRHRWSAASTAVTRQLLAGQGGDQLDAILRNAQQTASADFTTLALVVEPERLRVEAARGVLAEQVLGLSLDLESSMAGQVARSKEPVLTADYRDASGVDQSVPIGSVVMVPLLAGDEVLGVLSVGRLTGRRPFTDADVVHIAGFAGHAGVAMELDRARSDRQQRRILDDRDRIGVDLNRHVIQKLVAVGIGLQSLAAITTSQTSRKRINSYVADIDATIERMRATIFDAPTAHDPNTTDLGNRILAAVDDQTAALGCAVVTTFTGHLDRAIPDTLVDNAATVVREALASIAVGARATRVELRVDVGSDLLTVAILDNGTKVAAADREGGTQLVWTVELPTAH
jgi:signal transduction histidine kinase